LEDTGLVMNPRGRRLAAGATQLAGALTLVSALTPSVPWRDEVLLTVAPGPLLALGHVLAALTGLTLVALGRGIARGRRSAADAAILVLLVTAALHLAKGLDYEEAAVALVLAALLRVARDQLVAGEVPRRAVRAGMVSVAAIAAAYTAITLPMLERRGWPLARALELGATRLAAGGWWLRSERPLALLLDAFVAAAALAGLAALHALLRPEVASDGHSPGDRARASQLVERYGHDSLAPFTLREDKSFHFAAGGFLAYRTLRGTAVVSGDPVGPRPAWALILASFMAEAARRGWRVVLTAASDRQLDDYRALGLRTLHIGNEAVVDPRSFSLEGRSIRKVRQAISRVRRRGWAVEVADCADIAPSLADEIHSLERQWQASRPRLYGYAMTLGAVSIPPAGDRSVYALARDPDGRLGAFIRFVPYGMGLSLDTMRRRSGEVPNGLNEALVVAAIEHARERGAREVSLNFAGFAHVMAADAALSRRLRLLRFALRRLHSRFQLERLVMFNSHFRPEWRPRYLVYGGQTELAPAALRVLQAEAYVRRPRTRPFSARGTPGRRALGAPVRHALRGTPR
jgi:lysyl-tRNA synthetase class 2